MALNLIYSDQTALSIFFLWVLCIVSNKFFTKQITTKWLYITTVLIVTMPDTAVHYKVHILSSGSTGAMSETFQHEKFIFFS